MDDLPILMGYQTEYKNLNLKLSKDQPLIYQLGIAIAVCMELDKGYGYKNICKPTRAGTKITYYKIENEKQLEALLASIKSLIDMLKREVKEHGGVENGNTIG